MHFAIPFAITAVSRVYQRVAAYQKIVFSTASFAIHTDLSMFVPGLVWFSRWHKFTFLVSDTSAPPWCRCGLPACQALVSQLRRQFAEGRVAKGWKSQTKLHTNIHKHTRIYCANKPDQVPTLFSDCMPEQQVFYFLSPSSFHTKWRRQSI